MKEFVDRLKSFLSLILILAVFVGAGFGAGYYYCKNKIEPKAEVVEEKADESDLKLPTEQEKRVVTKDEVEAKLEEIGELTTYMGNYHVEKEADFSTYLGDDFKIPGTTNIVNLSGDGIVKVSYELSDVNISITDDTIFISLPEAYISDNYLVWDSVECSEQNNPLNPIDFSEYQGLIPEMEEEGLAKVEEQGIYDAAEDNAKTIITQFLEIFEDYSVNFI